MADYDFFKDTWTIREWLRGGTVNTDNLALELRRWADYWTQAPSPQNLQLIDGTVRPPSSQEGHEPGPLEMQHNDGEVAP